MENVRECIGSLEDAIMELEAVNLQKDLAITSLQKISTSLGNKIREIKTSNEKNMASLNSLGGYVRAPELSREMNGANIANLRQLRSTMEKLIVKLQRSNSHLERSNTFKDRMILAMKGDCKSQAGLMIRDLQRSVAFKDRMIHVLKTALCKNEDTKDECSCKCKFPNECGPECRFCMDFHKCKQCGLAQDHCFCSVFCNFCYRFIVNEFYYHCDICDDGDDDDFDLCERCVEEGANCAYKTHSLVRKFHATSDRKIAKYQQLSVEDGDYSNDDEPIMTPRSSDEEKDDEE